MTAFTIPFITDLNDLGIDCTYRQLDYWCAQGLLGPERSRRQGPGWRRRGYDSTDLEVIYALCAVRNLSKQVDLSRVAEIVVARPVNPDGEVLVVEPDGNALRFDHWCATTAAPVMVIPLRSFARVPELGDTRDDGRHRPHPVPAAPSP